MRFSRNLPLRLVCCVHWGWLMPILALKSPVRIIPPCCFSLLICVLCLFIFCFTLFVGVFSCLPYYVPMCILFLQVFTLIHMISISACSRFSIRFVFFVRSFDIVVATPPPCLFLLFLVSHVWFPNIGGCPWSLVSVIQHMLQSYSYIAARGLVFLKNRWPTGKNPPQTPNKNHLSHGHAPPPPLLVLTKKKLGGGLDGTVSRDRRFWHDHF